VALIKKPENRTEAVRKVVEKLGGKLGGFWFAFGDHDLIGMIEMPDAVGAGAFAMAISAGGACDKVKTTPLMNLEDAIASDEKGRQQRVQAGRREEIEQRPSVPLADGWSRPDRGRVRCAKRLSCLKFAVAGPSSFAEGDV